MRVKSVMSRRNGESLRTIRSLRNRTFCHRNTERQINVPFLSRRERLRRSLNLPNAPDYPRPRIAEPGPVTLASLDCGLYEGNPESDGVPPADLEEWRELFVRWLDSVCALHPRVFGGVSALHRAYCEWGISQGGVPCTRKVFERLLTEQGFLIGEINGTVLVSGLAFRSDLEAAGL